MFASLRASILALAAPLLAAMPAHAQDIADCGPPRALPLTLRIAELRVVNCNRDVRAATLAYQGAVADLRTAGQRPNPTLSLGASNVNPHVGVGAGPLRDKAIDSSVRLEQLVERGGKAGLRMAQARSLLDAARADVAEQARLQRLAMRTAFFDLAAAQERARLQGESQLLTHESARAARQRFDAGEISRAEADRFRLDAARAANDLRQAKADLQKARVELARLIGAESVAAALEVEVAWADGQERAHSNDERPDVAAARRRVEAAEAGRDLARKLSTRDVTVGVQADRWPVTEANLQGTGISYAINVSLPLQVRHANEGEAARAAADLEAARAALERLVVQARADAEAAEEEWRAARERREQVESEVRPVAGDVARAAEFAYARGATGVLDLLDARRSLKAVELDEVQARAEAAKAWARREAARETFAEDAR
ncbi:MAG: TolC family protein [Usitatibacter sp.]